MSANIIQKATGSSPTGLADSLIFDDGSKVGVVTTAPAALFDISKSLAGSLVELYVINTSTASSANGVRVILASNGANNTGDVYTRVISKNGGAGESNWSYGIDASNSGAFSIGRGSEPGDPGGITITVNDRVGIGEVAPGSKLSVSGNATIGAGYDTTAAPTNGLLVQGNVGIGTTAPDAPLHVSGAVAGNLVKLTLQNTSTASSANGVSLTLLADGTNNTGDVFTRLISKNGGAGESSWSYGIDTSNSGGFSIGRGSQPGDPNGLTIAINDRVGIGEVAPGSKLSVSGNATIGAGYDTTAAPTNGLLVEGNVGIGTASPAQPLHVLGTTPMRLERSGVGSVDLGVSGVVGTADLVISPQTNNSGIVLQHRTSGGSLTSGLTLSPAGAVTIAGNLTVSGALSASLNATNLSSGSVPYARLPSASGTWLFADGAVLLIAGGTSSVSAAHPGGSDEATPVDLGLVMSDPNTDPGRLYARSLVLSETDDPVDLRIRSGVTTRSITSLTRSSSTATATTAGDHQLTTGTKVRISGASPNDYNGAFIITVTGSTTFTYTVGGTPATPASGTIVMGGGKGSHGPFTANTTPGSVPGKIQFDMLADYTEPLWKEHSSLEARVKQFRRDGSEIEDEEVGGNSHPGEMYIRAYPENFDESVMRAIFSGDGTIWVGGGGYGADGLPNHIVPSKDVNDMGCLNIWGGGLRLNQLTQPVMKSVASGDTAAVGSSGSTHYTYRVVAVDVAGNLSPVSDPVQITNGNATLSENNYNRVAWDQVFGAEYDIVLRTIEPGDSITDKALRSTVPKIVTAENYSMAVLGSGDDATFIHAEGNLKAIADQGSFTNITNNGSFTAPATNRTGDIDFAESGALRVDGRPNLILETSNIKCDADYIPKVDNTYDLGTNSLRWKLVRGTTITSGDLRFENDFVLTEHYNLGNDVPPGIALLDDRDPENPRVISFFAADGTLFTGRVRPLEDLGTFTVRGRLARTSRPQLPHENPH